MDNLNFDQLMNELSKAVSKLEGGELTLEDAMNEYKRGIDIIKQLNEKLNNAKEQMKVIKFDD
ncbi:MAG: exodeoxyribonuclease VII small subunit [Clostridia bacterium]|nr:exodeoxyribonuclease VII small subunit [Clostridia bacterium]